MLEDHSPRSASASFYEFDADGRRMVRKVVGLQRHGHSPDRQPGRIW